MKTCWYKAIFIYKYVYLAAPEINDKENVVFVTLRIVGPKHEKPWMFAGKNTANK